MSTESVCRVCLASGDVRIYVIEDTYLRETFERLTQLQINIGNGRTDKLCYICFLQLQKCRRFSDMAVRSDRILRDKILSYDAEIANSTNAMINLRATQYILSITAVHTFSTDVLPNNQNKWSLLNSVGNRHYYNYVCMYDSTPVTIKEERVAVKEEVTARENAIETERIALVKCDEIESSLTSTKNKNASSKIYEDLYLRCSKKFSKPSNFKTHSKMHAVENNLDCTSCSKTFNFLGHLNRHMRSHIKTYVCDRCSKKFKLKSALEAHLRTHTGEKPFACEVCGKMFNQKSHLKTHTRTHTGAKPFACETCGKAFRQRGQLVSHIRCHTGEKPFACNRCDMTFGHLTTLRKHKRLHTEVKPYACNSCPTSFDQELRLTRHMRVHTAERPHACHKCDKSFLEARHLKEHEHSVHSTVRPHACRCGKTFKRPEHLKQHVRSSKCEARLDSSTMVLA